MVYGFDLDGVLASYVFAFSTKLNRDYGYAVVREDDVKRWDWSDDWYSQASGKQVKQEDLDRACNEIDNDDAWWETLQPLASHVEFALINELSKIHIVYFVTARQSYGQRSPQIQSQNWLKVQGIEFPAVVICSPHDKAQIVKDLGVQYFIDDRVDTLHEIALLCPKGSKSQCRLFRRAWPFNDTVPDHVAIPVRSIIEMFEKNQFE